MVSITPRPLQRRGKSPWYTSDRRLGGPQSRSGRRGKEKNLTPHQDSHSDQPVQLVASRYTDWTIQAPLYICLCVCVSVYLSIHSSIQPSLWLYSPFLDLGRFSVSWSFTQSVGRLGRVISPSQGRYLHTEHKTQEKRTQTSVARAMIRAFERAKTVHVLGRAATVSGWVIILR
jgi:hypothetical protein